jgi:hypothetical protein
VIRDRRLSGDPNCLAICQEVASVCFNACTDTACLACGSILDDCEEDCEPAGSPTGPPPAPPGPSPTSPPGPSPTSPAAGSPNGPSPSPPAPYPTRRNIHGWQRCLQTVKKRCPCRRRTGVQCARRVIRQSCRRAQGNKPFITQVKESFRKSCSRSEDCATGPLLCSRSDNGKKRSIGDIGL